MRLPGPTHRVVTCESAAEAQAAIAVARRILEQLGVQLHPQKTRVVHIQRGFEFLGYKIKRGKGRLRLSPDKIRSGMQPGALYAYPREKSIRRFMDQVRALTTRRVPLQTKELIAELNPVLRGSGPTSEGSSTNSTAGLCGGSVRIDSNAGGTKGGNTFRTPSCAASMGLLASSG